MKALVYTQYGSADVLELKESEKPLPGDNEVLIKIHATTVNRFFARIVTGLLKPKHQTPGSGFASVVEATGSKVASLTVGSRVFGFTNLHAGCHAEYLTTTEANAVTIPDGVSFELAAASSEGAHYAYNFINKVEYREGQHVLVNGANGVTNGAGLTFCLCSFALKKGTKGFKNLQLLKFKHSSPFFSISLSTGN